jgi:hypothetical protein
MERLLWICLAGAAGRLREDRLEVNVAGAHWDMLLTVALRPSDESTVFKPNTSFTSQSSERPG